MFNQIMNKGKRYDYEKVRNMCFLDDKIDYFFGWYSRNVNHDISSVKKLIDKMAVWYELRYPNSYFIHDIDENDMRINRDNPYDFEKFFSILSSDEKNLLAKPAFPSIVDLYSSGSAHFHVDPDGKIVDASDAYISIPHFKGRGLDFSTGEELFEGLNIRDIEKICIENRLQLDMTNIKKLINSVDSEISVWEGLLDTVLYKIIQNGGEFYGPTRGMLFATEFKRPLKIPVQYGVEDKGLVSEYLDNGGNADFVSYPGYFTEEKSSRVGSFIKSYFKKF